MSCVMSNAQVFDDVEDADLESPATEVQHGTSAGDEAAAQPAGLPSPAQSDPKQVILSRPSNALIGCKVWKGRLRAVGDLI